MVKATRRCLILSTLGEPLSRHLKKKMEHKTELEELEIYEEDLRRELREVRHELEDLEMKEQEEELQDRLRELELENLELQLKELRMMDTKEKEAQLGKLEQSFLKVSTLCWFISSLVKCSFSIP